MNIVRLFTLCVVAIGLLASTGRGSEDLLAEARAALSRNQPKQAVELLERGLASRSGESSATIELLCKAYQAAADQAKAAGRDSEAEDYLENLTILSRKSSKPQPAAAPASPPPSSPPPAARPEAPTRPAAPEPLPSPEPAPAPRLMDVPGLSNPEPKPTASAERPEPKTVALPTLTPEPDATATATAPPAEPRTITVAEADLKFRAKDYETAGKIYAKLAQDNKLPENRRDHWAYCRSVQVARKIDAGPGSNEAWRELYGEIDRIRQLSPKSWVAGYLKKLADERSSPPSASKPGAIARGANPNSDELAAERPMPPVARQAPVPRQPKPQVLDLPKIQAIATATPEPSTAPAASAPSGRWQVIETENFRVYHEDADLARKVADVAEKVREVQSKRWGGSDPLRWTPMCDVYVFPDARAFAAATSQPESSPGFSTLGANQGKIVQRLVNVRADHPGMLSSVLPHEVTHVVLADFFREQAIPRWADEGMAVLSEPTEEQAKRARDLAEPLRSGRLFKMSDLLRMDHPEGPDWPVYYAQSVSITRYLVELGGPARFIDFLQGVTRRGVEAELLRVYKIDSLTRLQDLWLASLRAPSETP